MARPVALLSPVLLMLLVSGAAAQSNDEGFHLRQRTGSFLEDANNVGQGLLSWLTTSLEDAWDAASNKHEHEHKGALVGKFVVWPGKEEDFVSSWKRFQKDALAEEEGIKVLTLSKTTTDNVIFYSYAEFEDKKAFFEHVHGKAAKRFAREVADADIVVEITPTIKLVTESGKGYSDGCFNATAAISKRRGWGAEGPVDIVARVLVPPSRFEDFAEIAIETAHKVGKKESKNVVYTVQKSIADNVESIIYGKWETLDDWFDHLESEHVHQLGKFYSDNKIIFKAVPLITIAAEYRGCQATAA